MISQTHFSRWIHTTQMLSYSNGKTFMLRRRDNKFGIGKFLFPAVYQLISQLHRITTQLPYEWPVVSGVYQQLLLLDLRADKTGVVKNYFPFLRIGREVVVWGRKLFFPRNFSSVARGNWNFLSFF